MATPKKKYPYNFIYDDGQYMTFEVTNEEYRGIGIAILNQMPAAVVESGIISLKSLRFVVELTEPKPEQPLAPAPDADPIIDPESALWLRTYRGEE